MQPLIYPSPWQLGKPRGSIKDTINKKTGTVTSYSVTLSPPNAQPITKFFSISEYGSQTNAKKASENWRQTMSDQYNLTRNQIRYLDKDTIEVQLTQGKTMKTDAKYIDEVQKYPINIKTKKSKSDPSKDRHYAMCQNIKEVFPFADLICKYDIIEYINGDSLDVRKENIKEFGSVKTNNIKVGKNIVHLTDNDINIQYECFTKDIDQLPVNIWLRGKPAGSVFKRTENENIYIACVTDRDGVQHAKTFNITKYNSDEEAKRVADKWQYETSYKLGMTKNLIRVVDDNTIEVKLTKDEIMKTDKIFIPLIQEIPLFITEGSNKIKYVATSINNRNCQFHGLITDFDMVDHMNGDTLDNRLSNLRVADFSLNNSNRHNDVKGVKKVDAIFGKSYKASIKIDGKEYSKYIPVDNYDEGEALEIAKNMRKAVTNVDLRNEKTQIIMDPKIMNIQIKKLDKILKLIRNNTCYDNTLYLTHINLPQEIKDEIFYYYVEKQMDYYRECKEKRKKIMDIMNKKTDVYI
ncbi:HNH endonuclease [Klosneuvirus KNV1]|uniref:HNH endonuclease n=1 Tax=Klosneuvirus KNV1 TaxID=1977640 RepID=A0A1V0SM30_9VIRU|nr:HNH endonuclease [Klosneuvirus KNV1]